jgi:hypothetical protein
VLGWFTFLYCYLCHRFILNSDNTPCASCLELSHSSPVIGLRNSIVDDCGTACQLYQSFRDNLVVVPSHPDFSEPPAFQRWAHPALGFSTYHLLLCCAPPHTTVLIAEGIYGFFKLGSLLSLLQFKLVYKLSVISPKGSLLSSPG